MSKELEAINKIMETYGNTNSLEGTYNYFLIIKKGLQRLESIEKVKPSEALEKLKENTEMFDEIAQENDHSYKDNTVIEAYVYHFNNTVIEQTLIKAQEKEKVLEIIKERQVNIALLVTVRDVEEYNFYIPYEEYEKYLTQEEFDLLKRYFKNGNNL